MTASKIKKELSKAIDNMNKELAMSTDNNSLYSRGLSSEGYIGGYLDALNAIINVINKVQPSGDKYHIWKDFNNVEESTFLILLKDFLEGDETALVGDVFGKDIYNKLNSNGITDKYTKYEICIPLRIITINYSFFLGFFGESLKNMQTPKDFNKKFKIIATLHIKEKIQKYVEKYFSGEIT